MRDQTYIGILASLLIFSGCGANPDYGRPLKVGKYGQTSTVSATPSAVSDIDLAPCKTTTIYSGSDPALATTFSNSSACASTSNLRLVRIKVRSDFSPTARVCIVPLSFTASYPATCATINGQADFTLSTDLFSSVTLVYEAQLNSYMSYLNGQTASYPAMAFAAVR